MNWLILIAAYLIGGIPFGYLLVRWKTGADVRTAGSGNIGATNVHRAAGPAAGIATLALDAVKGYFAVWLMWKLSGASMGWASASGVAVMLGHVYTPFLGFKGGKGVATFLGAFLFLAPAATAAVFVVFAAAAAMTRIVSVGSILGAITFPLAVWLIQRPDWPLMAASVACCALVLYRHLENAGRIHAGTERVFTWGGRRG
ncbi:MAG: glycerol-3-phosphate 1-O-acyltransferase PlsY [Acidobacteriota bacterium]|nr:glycerol-3-phosphate 1-O-acyltransferase PlsY [Acidobacteriota bacterium]